MAKQEIPPNNNEESEKLENIPVDSYLAGLRTAEQKEKELKEQNFEKAASVAKIQEQTDIEKLSNEARLDAEKTELLGNNKEATPAGKRVLYSKENGTTKKGHSFLRKARNTLMGLFALGVTTTATAKNGPEKPLPDSTKNKTEAGVKSVEKINDQIRRDWNEYLKWLDGKGMKGKPELDKNNLGYKLFDEYVSTHNTSLSREVLPIIVKTMEDYREYVLDQHRKGLVKIEGITTEDQFMRRVMLNKQSKDPIAPGDDLTFTSFPEEFLIHIYNGKVSGTENKGFAKVKEVGPDYTKDSKTVGLPGSLIAKNK